MGEDDEAEFTVGMTGFTRGGRRYRVERTDLESSDRQTMLVTLSGNGLHDAPMLYPPSGIYCFDDETGFDLIHPSQEHPRISELRAEIARLQAELSRLEQG